MKRDMEDTLVRKAQHQAAVRLQASWRGLAARLAVSEMRAAEAEQAMFAMLEERALRIQAAWRRHALRAKRGAQTSAAALSPLALSPLAHAAAGSKPSPAAVSPAVSPLPALSP